LTGCTPLKQINIYTIVRSEPRKVVEVYIHDFIRCVLIELEPELTLLSLDLYPRQSNRPPDGRAVSIASDGVEIIERECECPKMRSLEGALQRCSILYDCVRDRCEEIEMKMLISMSVDRILETACREDLLAVALRTTITELTS